MLLFSIDVDISSKKVCRFIAENQSVIVPVQYSYVTGPVVPLQIGGAGFQPNAQGEQVHQAPIGQHQIGGRYPKNIFAKGVIFHAIGLSFINKVQKNVCSSATMEPLSSKNKGIFGNLINRYI